MDATIASWRREQRGKLIAMRETINGAERAAAARIIADKLDRIADARGVRSIGLYWPIKNEISLLHWGGMLAQRTGAALSLPVVIEPKAPLEYWRWIPGEAMEAGFWNIPRPTRREVLTPDLVLAPVVGFDRANYRLGYGGGYFDRTLAVLRPRPLVIGIGYGFSALETIFPQPHDVPLDGVLTERHATLPGGCHGPIA